MARAADAVQGRGTIVVCTTTKNVDERELSEALRAASAGARVVVVVALASTWEGTPPVADEAVIRAAGVAGGVRVVTKDEELARCLAS